MTTEPDRILVQNRVDFVTGAVRRYVPDVNGLTDVAERVQSLFAGPYTNDPLSVPAEGEWSALRTLGHMIAYAQMLHGQLDRMAHMTDPDLWRMDDAGIAEREDWESRSSQELVQLFVDAIGDVEGLLKHLPDSSWGRAGLHPFLGRRSILQQVRGAVSHLGGHVDQLATALGEA